MKKQKRFLFEDGWNSFIHVLLGVLSVLVSVLVFNRLYLIIAFTIYQLSQKDQTNTIVDLSEFFIGILIVKGFQLCL